MNPSPPTTNGANDSEPATLGDVLYAGGREAASEAEWCDLVAAIVRREPQALRELFERTHRLVFTLTARIVQDRSTAEEVALDVYLDVWHRASTYDAATGSVIAWIMNQTRSRAIDRVRHENRLKRVNPFPQGSTDDYVVDPDERRRLDEQRRVLAHALTVLTRDERNAIESAYFRENSYSEAAERLGEPVGTVKTRIRSGLTKLRSALSDRRSDL